MRSLSGRAKPTARRSTISEQALQPGDIVRVPFPYVEVSRTRERPALVVRSLAPSPTLNLLWVLMITSAENPRWDGDVSLEQRFNECGLPVPCVIRTGKIATIEAGRSRKQGQLPRDLLMAVRRQLAGAFQP